MGSISCLSIVNATYWLRLADFLSCSIDSSQTHCSCRRNIFVSTALFYYFGSYLLPMRQRLFRLWNLIPGSPLETRERGGEREKETGRAETTVRRVSCSLSRIFILSRTCIVVAFRCHVDSFSTQTLPRGGCRTIIGKEFPVSRDWKSDLRLQKLQVPDSWGHQLCQNFQQPVIA